MVNISSEKRSTLHNVYPVKYSQNRVHTFIKNPVIKKRFFTDYTFYYTKVK